MAQWKRLCRQETRVNSLDGEDPLEKEMDSIVAWRITWTEEPGGRQSMEWQGATHYEACTQTHVY